MRGVTKTALIITANPQAIHAHSHMPISLAHAKLCRFIVESLAASCRLSCDSGYRKADGFVWDWKGLTSATWHVPKPLGSSEQHCGARELQVLEATILLSIPAGIWFHWKLLNAATITLVACSRAVALGVILRVWFFIPPRDCVTPLIPFYKYLSAQRQRESLGSELTVACSLEVNRLSISQPQNCWHWGWGSSLAPPTRFQEPPSSSPGNDFSRQSLLICPEVKNHPQMRNFGRRG